jgi:predicted restriction endonuclease
MPLKPCIECGALSPWSRCPRHGGGASRITLGRGSGWQASAFRDAVLTAAGHRCQFINHYGVRCTNTQQLAAHHIIDLRDGGSNDPATNGRCLCSRHHAMAGRAG